jgi:LacI family transcriptional regulator
MNDRSCPFDPGITIDPGLTVQLEGDESGIDSGRIATVELLERGRYFSAIIAFNDLSAIGAIAALGKAGL